MKLNFEEIKELIEAIDNTEITKFEFSNEEFEINIEKEKERIVETSRVVESVPVGVATDRPVQVTQSVITPQENTIADKEESFLDEGLEVVESPIVGTFYDSPSPDSETFVKVGDSVKKGDILCIVEAMKIMNEIKSEYDGVVAEILLENEDIVEYGQPLMLIRSN